MKLTYDFDPAVLELSEAKNEKDVEFELRVPGQDNWNRMKEIRDFFENNDVYTDVLFYVYENHRVKAIVRNDYYVDFVLALLKYGLIKKAEWA